MYIVYCILYSVYVCKKRHVSTYVHVYVYVHGNVWVYMYTHMSEAQCFDFSEVLLLPLLIGPSDTLTKTMPEAAGAASDLEAPSMGRFGFRQR